MTSVVRTGGIGNVVVVVVSVVVVVVVVGRRRRAEARGATAFPIREMSKLYSILDLYHIIILILKHLP